MSGHASKIEHDASPGTAASAGAAAAPATRLVRYAVAASLDGYISGPNGESDWIVIDPEHDFRTVLASFDTLLLGRRTYESTRVRGGRGGGGMPGIRPIVFSRTLRAEDVRDAELSNDPERTIGELKRTPGKDVWLFGGGGLFKSLLELELVDRVEVALMPVLLGRGRPLLPETERGARLRLTDERVYRNTGTVVLHYDVVRGGPRGARRA